MSTKHLKSWVSALTGMTLLMLTMSAQAFEAIKMGDWDVSFSGNINGFLTEVDCDTNANGVVAGGLACGSLVGSDYDQSNIRTGLLPSWLGLNAKTEVGGIKTEVNIGFQPGIDSNTGISGTSIDGGLGLNSANFRQVNLKFGADWGTITIGRDLGVFGSDAILSDMTLLGVGTVSDLTSGGGNTSLGRIGLGYVYADWKGQIQYASRDFSGFSFNVALVDPWGLVNLSGHSLDASSFSQKGDTYGFEGKAAYSWGGEGSATTGKAWAGFISQSIDSTSFASQDATGAEFGAKVEFGGLELFGYFYSGDGIGTTDFLFDAVDLSGATRDSDGFIAQATYKFGSKGTKVGVSVGESNLDLGPGDLAVGGICEVLASASCTLVETNESVVFGVYHPLTPALNLVFEYTASESTAHNGNSAEETVIAIGAILFY